MDGEDDWDQAGAVAGGGEDDWDQAGGGAGQVGGDGEAGGGGGAVRRTSPRSSS